MALFGKKNDSGLYRGGPKMFLSPYRYQYAAVRPWQIKFTDPES